MKIVTMKTSNIPRDDCFRGSIYTVKRKEVEGTVISRCILTFYGQVSIQQIRVINATRLKLEINMTLKYGPWNSKRISVAWTSQNTTTKQQKQEKVN